MLKEQADSESCVCVPSSMKPNERARAYRPMYVLNNVTSGVTIALKNDFSPKMKRHLYIFLFIYSTECCIHTYYVHKFMI